MKSTVALLLVLGAAHAMLLSVGVMAGERPRTGPDTEKRFPPLKVPPGFKATLFACDPLIEYPSAIALGPRPGTLFVAVDYLTGLGTEIVRRDEIRLLEDTDGDGYADRAPVYAHGFNSIQGLAYHDGAVYVMHAPLLTVLRDTNGDGRADERRDLLSGLGPAPEKNPVRLHAANGVVAGHDGWLYLALGDHGCDVRRPEGDRLMLQGGGILRCRPDGRDLHVFAMGLRNIYDIALDDELNVFVRDNENDGGDYKIRVCHCFFGADHGYPYLYSERPDEALPPLADLGLGSSAGGLCYQETGFPPECRGNLFFCEWGRAVVRYRPERSGSGFGPLQEIAFASGADNDPYGFKPTDLVVDHDGSLLVADWADGQRPKRGRGRIYRIRYVGADARQMPSEPLPAVGNEQQIARLDSESYYMRARAQAAIERRGRDGLQSLTAALDAGRVGVRGRLHAVWILARVGGPASIDRLLAVVKTDPDPRVQAQAVRAIADLADPVLAHHRLDAGPGDAGLASRLVALAAGRDPRVDLEIVIAVGRLRWPGAPTWLRNVLTKPDPTLCHAAQQALRRSGNWPAVLQLIDEPHRAPIRAVALRAAAGQAVPEVVDGLIDRLRSERTASRRAEYAGALTRVYKRSGPQPYWGYRPAPRPPNTLTWERTEAIEQALDHVLGDSDREVRLAVLRRMLREKVPARPPTLGRWLQEERQIDRVAAILEALQGQPAGEVRDLLARVVREREHATANRRAALAALDRGPPLYPPPSQKGGYTGGGEAQLLELSGLVEDGPVLADLLRRTGKRPRLHVEPLLLRKAASPDAEVRAAAVEALAARRSEGGHNIVCALLEDKDARVRRAAAAAAGDLAIRPATPTLLKLTRDADPDVRRASFGALRQLREPLALPLAVSALEDRETQRAALECLSAVGGPDQTGALVDLAKRDPAGEVVTRVVRVLTEWRAREALPGARKKELDRAVAAVHGTHGVLLRWHAVGPIPPVTGEQVLEREASSGTSPEELAGAPPDWRMVLAVDTESPLDLGKRGDAAEDAVWFGVTECLVPEATAVQFRAAGRDGLQVWLNGHSIYRRAAALPSPADAGPFPATLRKGLNRLLVRVSSPKGPATFALRFRRQSRSAEHERLTQAALTRVGDAERGRKVFFDADKSQCVKCHRVGDQGERIGPELTGLGSRFSRITIVESILEPSRAVTPGFQTQAVVLKNGRLLTGVKMAETETTLTLADNQGQKHELSKADIEEQRPQPVSIMPEGLEQRLTTDEFVDLVAFLARPKDGPSR